MERILIERLKLHLSSSSGGAPLEKELYISKFIMHNHVADVADVDHVAGVAGVTDIIDVVDVADVADFADVSDVGDDKEKWVAP